MPWPIHPLQLVATDDFWQSFGAQTSGATARNSYPVRLLDGAVLQLPIRRLAARPGCGVASLISNQTSFAVEDAISGQMAELARSFAPEMVVGMPTLGLVYAAAVARRLGMTNYVPLGYSRKFWYDDALSEPVRSITTPDQAKRVYLDPNLVARLAGKRILVIDDVVSSGTTALAVVRLLRTAGAEPVGLLAAMLQGEAWRANLETLGPGWPDRVAAVMHSPILVEEEAGWRPLQPETGSAGEPT